MRSAIGCTSREDCDVEFVVDAVSTITCPDAFGLTEETRVVRVDIEVEVRDQVNYPDALDVFYLGDWSAVTEDGYTLRALDTVSNCDGQDASLLTYGINAGEKVRNSIDFLLPNDVEKVQLQPHALDGGGWNWPVT